MTPREIGLQLEGVRKRLIREHNDRAWVAYTTAVLHRMSPKRFPKLDKLLYQERKKKRQHWTAQLEVAKQWNDIYNRRKKK